jgi:hypothetical protein
MTLAPKRRSSDEKIVIVRGALYFAVIKLDERRA